MWLGAHRIIKTEELYVSMTGVVPPGAPLIIWRFWMNPKKNEIDLPVDLLLFVIDCQKSPVPQAISELYKCEWMTFRSYRMGTLLAATLQMDLPHPEAASNNLQATNTQQRNKSLRNRRWVICVVFDNVVKVIERNLWCACSHIWISIAKQHKLQMEKS